MPTIAPEAIPRPALSIYLCCAGRDGLHHDAGDDAGGVFAATDCPEAQNRIKIELPELLWVGSGIDIVSKI